VAPRLDTKARTRPRQDSNHTFVWQIVRGVVRLCVLVMVLGLTWYLTRLPFFTITEVTVSGGETISHEDVRAQVIQELQGTYFLIIPKRFTYMYPEKRIYEVLAKNTSMYDVVVERSTRKELAVSFKEHVPYALWCDYDATTSPCFFMTKTGYAFGEAPMLHGGALIRHAAEGVNDIAVGNTRSEEEIAKVDSFINRVEQELGLRIATVVYKQNGDIEFTINGGGQVFVSGGKDFDAAFSNLTAVLASDEFKHIEPGNFKYIDVRFNNKVFVNETLGESGSSTATSSEELPE
jgi:cell division septal protein FtsQ